MGRTPQGLNERLTKKSNALEKAKTSEHTKKYIYEYLCKSLELAKTLGLTNKINSRLQNMLIITSSQFFHSV